MPVLIMGYSTRYRCIQSAIQWIEDGVKYRERQHNTAKNIPIHHTQIHSVLTICTQTGTCDTRSGDLVFFSAAFDEFSVFTKN